VGAGPLPSGPSSGSPPATRLRELVLRDVVARQLARHLPDPPARVLQVGATLGHALPLAGSGSAVLLAEPDAERRAAAVLAREAAPEEVRARLVVADGWPAAPARFDLVLSHDPAALAERYWDALVELCDLVAPGGVVSLLTPNADGAALRPAVERQWADALDLLSADDPEPACIDDLGRPVRARRLEQLASYVAGRRMHVEAWYGVGLLTVAADADEPAPDDPDTRDAVLAAEELAGRTDPYRRVSPWLHVVGRRAAG
jgi:SAM-dependent methyltransferase